MYSGLVNTTITVSGSSTTVVLPSSKNNPVLTKGDKYEFKNAYHSWMDPGAIALIGAASFFAGVSRLTISLTVIMIEITNDVTMLLPVMTGIGSLMVALILYTPYFILPRISYIYLYNEVYND